MGISPKFPKRLQWLFSFLLFLLLLMMLYRLIFFYHYRTGNRPLSGSTLILGLRYDARVIGVLGLLMLILSSFKKLNPFKNAKARKFWNIFIVTCFAILLIFYATDYYYFDYLRQRLNASVINFLSDTAISFGMMWQTYPLLSIFIAIIIFLVVITKLHNAFLKKLVRSQQLTQRKYARGYFLLTVLLFFVLIFGKLGQYPLRWSDAFSLADDFKANAALNPFQSFFSSLQFKNSGYDLAKVKKHYTLMADYLDVQNKDSVTLNYKRQFLFRDTFVTKPNVVVVICESFSAYKSSMFGNKLNPTPYFNKLCNEGVFFERCFTPAFGTARGVWATITGIPDVESPKTASRNPAAVDQHTIINDFKTYDKFYFLGGSTTWANIRGLLNNNIEGLKIYEQESFVAAKVDVWGISDKNLFLEANKILSKQSKPFFAIIQTADNHRPYTIPSEDLKEFRKVDYPTDTIKKYGFSSVAELNAFRYTDFCYQKFMDAAAKEKYYDNTVFVFVGDHGLRGDAGNMFPQSFTKQGILAEHVPLLFYSPRLLTPQRIKNVCSQLDIMPTVASITKQSYVNNSFGRNLLDSNDRRQRFAFIADPDLQTIGLVSNEYYYVHNLKTLKQEFVSVTNNDAISMNKSTDSMRNYMQQLTWAWYETAKYLLLHNKKNRPS
jgi:phosphoglycerol transferase MdoB-like AlkP superfamily enzyme